MPHGGGHAHHGGGGGGHHHHHSGGHHHHHHHNRHYGGVVYTGGGYYGGYRSRYKAWMWGGIGFLLIAAIVIAVTCSVTLSKEEEEENRFTPGDTRIKKFENFFCSGVKVSTTYRYKNQSAHAYVIEKKPSLTDKNNVSFEDFFTLYEDDYHYWHFYLYKNSNISLEDYCIKTGSGYWFYIIKGTSKWNDWKDYASSSKAVFNAYITNPCDKDMVHKHYRVSSNDHYYIAYLNNNDNKVSGKQTLRLDRFEYSVPEDHSNLPSCSFAGPNVALSCKLKVPMLSNQTKVLVRFPNATDESSKEDMFHVSMDCMPRPEAYLIVVLPPVVALAVIVIICVIACVVWRKKARKQQYRPLLSEGSSTSTNNASAPPPFNPDYKNEVPPPPPYSQ